MTSEKEFLLKIGETSLKGCLPIFNKVKDKLEYYIDDGLLKYYIKMLDKYRKTKTLLHRQPTDFYEIYYPAKLEYDKLKMEIDDIEKLFIKGSCITIIGDAGSGKSTLVKHLFITSIRQSFKAPIFIALRDLEIETSNLEIYIRKEILDNKLSPSDDFLTKLLEEGNFLFFLDGYDEIKSDNKQKITKNIEKFIEKYPKNNFILTSRPYSSIEYFQTFYNYEISNLDKEDRKKFVEKQIKDTKLSSKINESIEEIQHDYIESFFKNPLLLTLYIITYSKNSNIPSKKYIFYRRVFDVLFSEHDTATKIGFEREIKSQLGYEQLEKIMQLFSFLSFFKNEFDFDKEYIHKTLKEIKNKKAEIKFRNDDFIEDMILSVGLWSEDSGVFSFAHRSMQEYFAASYVSGIKNLKNKEKIYKRLHEYRKYSKFDIRNFLSLSYEMDREFFLEHYSKPVLNELKIVIMKAMEDLSSIFTEIIESGGFILTKEGSILNGLTIFPQEDFIDEMFEIIKIISKHSSHRKFDEYFIYTGENIFVPKKNEITDENYSEFLKEIGVKIILENIIECIELELVEISRELERNCIAENEITDMI